MTTDKEKNMNIFPVLNHFINNFFILDLFMTTLPIWMSMPHTCLEFMGMMSIHVKAGYQIVVLY